MKKKVKIMLSFSLLLLFCFIPYSLFNSNGNFITKKEIAPGVMKSYVVQADQFDKKEREQQVERIHSEEERIRFLLLGTDERKDEPARSDTIVLATYYPNEGKMNMVSVPRDTKVHIPGQEKELKINSAHAIGGMPLVKQTVEEWSGLQIDHVAKVNFNGFKELIDEVDGVEVNAKSTLSYGGITIHEGKQTLSGKEALTYVRFRKDGDGDFGRIKRQQEVIQNTIKAVLSDFDVFSLPTYLQFYEKHIDTDMSFTDMYKVAKTAYSNGVTLEGKTIPTHSSKEDGIWYELEDEQEKQNVLNWLEKKPNEVIPSPHELQSEERVSGPMGTP